MKTKLLAASAIAVAVVYSASVANAAGNDTPQARACMAQNGFTYAEWRAYKVPADKADAYRRCLASAKSSYTSGKVLASEPPPRMLGTGQTVYVSCGGGKKRSVTGGSSGQPRTYGECK